MLHGRAFSICVGKIAVPII